jgi:hypothetical protein
LNINDNNKLAVIYNFLDASKINPHPSALGFRGPNASILQFEKSGYQINNKLDSFLAELNSKVKQFLINYKWVTRTLMILEILTPAPVTFGAVRWA